MEIDGNWWSWNQHKGRSMSRIHAGTSVKLLYYAIFMSHSSQVAKPSWGMTTKPSSEFLFFCWQSFKIPCQSFLAHKNYKIFCWWWLYVPLKKQEKYWEKTEGFNWPSKDGDDQRKNRIREALGSAALIVPQLQIVEFLAGMILGSLVCLPPPKKKQTNSPEMDGSSTVQPTNNWRFMIGFSTSYELGTVCNWMHSDAPC